MGLRGTGRCEVGGAGCFPSEQSEAFAGQDPAGFHVARDEVDGELEETRTSTERTLSQAVS